MEKIVTVSEMRAIEHEANQSGLTYPIMMENAGRGLAEIVASACSHNQSRSVLALVGPGNNGGDALVALTFLQKWGWKTSAYCIVNRNEDPLVNQLKSIGGEVSVWGGDVDEARANDIFSGHMFLVDGLLGTGARLPLKSEFASFLVMVNGIIRKAHHRPFIVAVDCPSGIDCDSGYAADEVIRADLTVTMAAIKQGLLQFPAADLTGEIRVVGIGLIENLALWNQIRRYEASKEYIKHLLPSRPRNAHKGTFGTSLIVAGSANYSGAALLAGEASYRVGAGLVTLAVPKQLHMSFAGQFLEATWLLLPEDGGAISADATDLLMDNIPKASAILLGPGFGLSDSTGEFIRKTLSSSMPPLVIDADGLKLLSRVPNWWEKMRPDSILTPHPGEMAILTGISKEEIQHNRIEIAEEYAQLWGHVVVLKGAYSVISSPQGETIVIPIASPALARAGTGDVLAGLIVGLLAQGVQPFNAAVLGAWIHGYAGLESAKVLGNTASIMAGDLIKAVPRIIAELQ